MRTSLVAISIIFLGLTNINAQETQEKPALPVQVFKIEDKIASANKSYPSILKAYEEVSVMARVKGILVEKYFQEGSFVKKGTLLYKIEPDTYLANLNMAKANENKAQANYNKSAKNYERGKALLKTKSISEQNFDEYKYLFENAKGELESAKAAVLQAQIQYNYTKIYAPIDGIVGIKNSDIGDLVGSNEANSLLITITNTNPVYAEFSLSKDDINSYISQIRNKTVKVNLIANDKVYENGEIDYVSTKIDSNTDTLLLRAKFENTKNELIIGDYAKIQINNLNLGDVSIIPENAVLKTAKGTFVYVIEDSIAKLKPVETGILLKDGISIKSGLKVDDQVVISNIAKLKPDTKIKILNKEK
ncbi:MAG: efflux RND transporter periplasmic adaptor subunit [Aliarcobacter sp.]|nr:efflux RND transporter periplasmic adaptor subunit [Aliarcobacter sp.]